MFVPLPKAPRMVRMSRPPRGLEMLASTPGDQALALVAWKPSTGMSKSSTKDGDAPSVFTTVRLAPAQP